MSNVSFNKSKINFRIHLIIVLFIFIFLPNTTLATYVNITGDTAVGSAATWTQVSNSTGLPDGTITLGTDTNAGEFLNVSNFSVTDQPEYFKTPQIAINWYGTGFAGDMYHIEYDIGNGTWLLATSFTTAPASLTIQYFDAPAITSWVNLSTTSVRFKNHAKDSGDDNEMIYIDAIWIKAEYDNATPTWPTDTGIISLSDLKDNGKLRADWVSATDADSGPVTYNVYIYNSSETFDWNTPNYTGITVTQYDIGGLTNDAEYRVGVRAVDAMGNIENNTINLTASPTIDTTAPWFLDVDVEEYSSNLIEVKFEIDEVGIAMIEWGLDTNYGNISDYDMDLTKNHEIHVFDLPGNTTFHFRILTNDSVNNQRSSRDYEYTTSIKHDIVNNDIWYMKFEADVESAYLFGNVTPAIILLGQDGNTTSTATVTYDLFDINGNSAIVTGTSMTYNSTMRQYEGVVFNTTLYEGGYLRLIVHATLGDLTIDEQQSFFIGDFENARGLPYKLKPFKTSIGPTFNASKDYYYYFRSYNDGNLPAECKGTITIDAWDNTSTSIVSAVTPDYVGYGVYNYTFAADTFTNGKEYTIRARCTYSNLASGGNLAYADSVIGVDAKDVGDINKPSLYDLDRDLWFPNADSQTIISTHVVDNSGPMSLSDIHMFWRKNEGAWIDYDMNQTETDLLEYEAIIGQQHVEDHIETYIQITDNNSNSVNNKYFGEQSFIINQKPQTPTTGLIYLNKNRFWFGNSTRYSEYASVNPDGVVYAGSNSGNSDPFVQEFQEFCTVRSFVMVLDEKGIPFSGLSVTTWLGDENATHRDNVSQYLVKTMTTRNNGLYEAVWNGYPSASNFTNWTDYEGDTGIAAESQYIWGKFISRETYYVYVDYDGDNESDMREEFLAYSLGDTVWDTNNNRDPSHCESNTGCGVHSGMYSVDRLGRAYCTDCHGMGYTEAINRSMLILQDPDSGGPSVAEMIEAGFPHPRNENVGNGLTEYGTQVTNGCANNRACHGDNAAGDVSDTGATYVPGYPDGTYDIRTAYYPNPSQCAACHTFPDDMIPNQQGHNNLIGCKFCHGAYHETHEYKAFDNVTHEGIPGYQETHEYAQSCYLDCHTVEEKHCGVISCKECHIGFDTALQHTTVLTYSDRTSCSDCHQNTGEIVEHDKTYDINANINSVPGIPQRMGADEIGDGWFDNETGDKEWTYWAENKQSCRYCHGRTYNLLDGIGRVRTIMGTNEKNSTINSTNNMCSSCHVDSYTSGDTDYMDMVNTYNGSIGLVPPEITGNNTEYAPGKYYYSTRTGYQNHNDSGSISYTNGNYSDAKCFECHGGALDIGVGMSVFMHNSTTYADTMGVSIAFAIGMPAQDCTEGQGSTDAGTTCNRCWFETVDTSGYSDESQVACEGQNSTVSFYVFDNQGDVNISWAMQLDSNLDTSKLRHKVSQIPGGYEATCGGDSATGCMYVETTTPVTIVTGIHNGAGSNDSEIWAWADFLNALAADSETVNITHVSSVS